MNDIRGSSNQPTRLVAVSRKHQRRTFGPNRACSSAIHCRRRATHAARSARVRVAVGARMRSCTSPGSSARSASARRRRRYRLVVEIAAAACARRVLAGNVGASPSTSPALNRRRPLVHLVRLCARRDPHRRELVHRVQGCIGHTNDLTLSRESRNKLWKWYQEAARHGV